MGLFPKEGDYVDYTLLKKKGILKVPETESFSLSTDGGFVDISKAMKSEISETLDYTPQSTSSSTPDLGFLGALAGVGNSENPPAIQNSSPSSDSPSEIYSIRIKLDDFEYKLERLIERITRMEESLANSPSR